MSNRDFVKVAEIGDIQPTNMKAVEVAGEKICAANVKGTYYAVGNICTHEGLSKVTKLNVLGMAPNLILELAKLQDILQINQWQPMK